MRSIEWLSGLLEGEGCFSTRKNHVNYHTTPIVEVAMTDRDVIEEARVLFEWLGSRSIKIRSRRLRSGKTAFHCSVTGLPAVKIMQAVLPFMGARRAAKIHTVMAEWNPVQYKEAIAYKRELQGVI